MLKIAASFFSLCQNLTYEIILTLGQAFEVAYQLALQAQRTKQHQNLPVGPGSDVIETKSSRPVPKPRGSIRKSGVSLRNTLQHRGHAHTYISVLKLYERDDWCLVGAQKLIQTVQLL